MKRIILTSTAMSALASAAAAGGIERTTQSTAVLFEQGRYMEFSLSYGSPDVSGTGGFLTTGVSSGDMTESYLNFGFAYKADLNDRLSYALIYDQPYGADVNYPLTGYFASGSTAEFRSHALTGVLQYNLGGGKSVFGGLRAQSIEATANVPFIPGGYDVEGDRDFRLGYLVGAAYEKPEIALRVALTYNSAITHELDTIENSGAIGAGRNSTTEIETPQSINLEFQSGVAEDTLVFGSVRWVEWSAFEISPADYITITGAPLVSYEDDRITYTLGVGRRLNETWSLLGSVSYEETTGSPTGNLGPTDGFMSVGLGAIYTKDNMKVTAGIRYAEIGDADTVVSGTPGAGLFRDNSAIGVGVKVGYQF